MIDPRLIARIKLYMLAVMILTLVPAIAQVVPGPPIQTVVPIDVVALVSAVFTGIAALAGIFVSIFLPILAYRQKRAEAAAIATGLEVARAQLSLNETKLEIARSQLELERVKDNVVLIERNTNSLTKEIAQLSKKEGEQIGRDKQQARTDSDALILEEGRRRGAESQRAGPGTGVPTSGDATIQAVTAAAAAAAAVAAPAAAALVAPAAAAIAAPPAADIAAPPVVRAVVPPAVDAAVAAAFAKQQLDEKK